MHPFALVSTAQSGLRAFIRIALVLTTCAIAPYSTGDRLPISTTGDMPSSAQNRMVESTPEHRPSSPESPQLQALQTPAHQGVLKVESKYILDAERFAQKEGCNQPTAKVVLRWPPAEMFTVDCQATDKMLVKCEADACLEMR
jgi:hypothetical protein